ncbi:MAG: redox-sensing transcriptional repressor Rex [Bacillota bacterium]
MKRFRVPDVVIRRLVLYLRILSEMDLGEGRVYISSQELGDRAGVSPAQVRKDLASFGEFGKQGVGYDAAYLREEIRSILNLHRTVNVAIIGVGELGTALARYVSRRAGRERRYPFRVAACFDSDPEKIDRVIEPGIKIRPPEELAETVERESIDIAVITVPAAAAQAVADQCVKAGVRALLNFAPVKLFVPENVRVHYSDVSLELQQLAYYLT